MKMGGRKNRVREDKNKGFSLIEVLVCVAVLAIICLPLFKSFETSFTYNRRSFETQNVTSFMQTVTEAVKYESKKDVAEGFTGAGGRVESVLDTVRQGSFPGSYPAESFTVTTCESTGILIGGKEYDLTVRYDPLPYSEKKPPETPALESAANDANVYTAAKISSIDSMRFPVISDEIGRYEGTETGGGAILYNLLHSMTEAEQESFGTSDSERLKRIYGQTTKHTAVTISGTDSITVNCDVTYKLNAAGRDVSLTYNVYRAVYELDEIRDADGTFRGWAKGGKVYIFAKAWQDQHFLAAPRYNSLSVENHYAGANPLDIYLVRGYYSDATAADPKASYKRGLQFDRVTIDGRDYYSIPSGTALTGEYSNVDSGGRTRLHTNIKGIITGRVLTEADMEETIGEEKVRVNCYEVAVTLTEQPSGTVAAYFETVREEKD